MVDIASTSSVSNQAQISRNSNPANAAAINQQLTKTAADSSTERKEVESAESSGKQRTEVESKPGKNVGGRVDIRA